MDKKKKQPKPPTVESFINKAQYDQFGTHIWGISDKKEFQLIAEVRGWGAIQNLFKSTSEAADFQDNLGKFIVEAINEKIERDKHKAIIEKKPQ